MVLILPVSLLKLTCAHSWRPENHGCLNPPFILGGQKAMGVLILVMGVLVLGWLSMFILGGQKTMDV